MNIDFLTPTQLQYPGLQSGTCQQGTTIVGSGGGFKSAKRDGVFNSIFTPDDLPYPLPIAHMAGGQCPPPSPSPAPTPQPPVPTPQPPVPTPQPPATSSDDDAKLPPQIVINVAAPACGPSAAAAPGAASATSGDSASSATPSAPRPNVAASATGRVISMPVAGNPPPSDEFVQAYAYNPRLRSRTPRAQEELLEEWLDEQISLRMLTAHSGPISFVVPDGCNAVDFYLGAIEVNPDIGERDDLDLIVTLGEPKLSANAQSGAGLLRAGDSVTVTLSWRYASWVELAPEHLRVPVNARFYTIQNF